MNLKTNKIAAFTLFESSVAVTIIAILIGLGSMIHGNVVSSGTPVVHYEAKNEVDRLFALLKIEKDYRSQTFDFDHYQIEQTINPYKGDQHLLLVAYHAKAAEDILFTERHLITWDKNEE